MYHYIVYAILTNPVVRYVRVADGQIWDGSTLLLARAPTYANTAIALTRNTSINGIPVTIPTTLPDGEYDMLFYDSASPAETDTVSLGKRIAWTKSGLLGLPLDL